MFWPFQEAGYTKCTEQTSKFIDMKHTNLNYLPTVDFYRCVFPGKNQKGNNKTPFR